MDKIIEQIEKIRDINKQHKLVIFVGAGVSRNSGVCSWWDLIKRIAIETGYNDICEKCELKHVTTTEGDESSISCIFNNRPCQYKFSFSSEEFLKIPQYYYEEKGEPEYLQLLHDVFCKTYEPNEIDELIVALEPEHIITTNYDHLIEDVKNPNISNYTVIKSNDDLLEKGRQSRKYIIKMHGDIDILNNIVLKEDDYLTYSLNHELLEIYIKSILIDKTILFVGYSLGDNNLKLIMSYINYFANTLHIKRPPHYLAVNRIDHDVRETKYWLNKGVELIDLSGISDFMKQKTHCNLNIGGKLLYTFLSYIKNDRLPYYKDGFTELKRSLINSIKSIEPFNRISYSTLLSICNFSHGTELQDGELYIFDSSDFNSIYSIFEQDDADSVIIKKCFINAGINLIYHYDFNKKSSYNLATKKEITDKLFNLSLIWDFKGIINQLALKENSTIEKAYYNALINKTKDNICLDILSNIESELNKKDFKYLTLNDKYQISILQFDLIAIRTLDEYQYREYIIEKEREKSLIEINNSETQKNEEKRRKEINTELENLKTEQWNKFNSFLDSASRESVAFDYIKKYVAIMEMK